MKLSAQKRIRRQILIDAGVLPELITTENADEIYDTMHAAGDLQDAIYSFRGSYDEVTDVPTPSNFYYECQSVARRLDDGAWVGWNYWYGGGELGAPELMDWMDSVYLLSVESTTVIVNVFTRV